jgi:hypothetical protein
VAFSSARLLGHLAIGRGAVSGGGGGAVGREVDQSAAQFGRD